MLGNHYTAAEIVEELDISFNKIWYIFEEEILAACDNNQFDDVLGAVDTETVSAEREGE